jgi:hypothetical protein
MDVAWHLANLVFGSQRKVALTEASATRSFC